MDAFGTYTVGRQVTWAEKCKNAAFHTRRNMIRARERSQNNENLHESICALNSCNFMQMRYGPRSGLNPSPRSG